MDIGTRIPLERIAPEYFRPFDVWGTTFSVVELDGEHLGFEVLDTEDGRVAELMATGWDRNFVGSRISELAMTRLVERGLEPGCDETSPRP